MEQKTEQIAMVDEFKRMIKDCKDLHWYVPKEHSNLPKREQMDYVGKFIIDDKLEIGKKRDNQSEFYCIYNGEELDLPQKELEKLFSMARAELADIREKRPMLLKGAEKIQDLIDKGARNHAMKKEKLAKAKEQTELAKKKQRKRQQEFSYGQLVANQGDRAA